MSLRLFFGANPDDPRLFKQYPPDEVLDDSDRDSESGVGDQEQFILLVFKRYIKYYNQHFHFVSSYKLKASITIEGNYYEVEFNQSLFSQLTKLYLIYGWKVIKSFDTAFKVNGWITDKPKGIVDLYIYTKKTLSVVVRHSLINIEAKARKLALEKLTNQLASIKTSLKSYSFYSPTFETRYFMAKREIADDLMRKLERVVSIRAEIESITKNNEEAKKVNSFFNVLFFLISGVPRPTYPAPTVPYNPLVVDNESITILQKELLASLLLLAKDHFLGLLLFTKLKKGFNQKEMESDLYSICSKMQDDISSMIETLSTIPASSAQSNSSKIETLIRWEKSDGLDIASFDDISDSIENRVINEFEGSKDFCLLSLDLLDTLVQLDLVERDSFEYPVLYQYKASLVDYLEKKEVEKRSSDEFWDKISKVSSFLTLTAVVPVIGEITGPIAIMLDLGLIFHTVSAINSQLESLEDETKLDLVSLEEGGPSYGNAMIRVGYLINQSETLKAEMFTQVAKEVVLQILGSKTQILLIKKAIAWRMYALDIQNLFEGG